MAEAYDAYAAPYHAAMVHRILDLSELAAGHRVLDLGCGPGNLTFEAIARVGGAGIAVGIDLADGMMRHAVKKAARNRVPNVRFERMDCRGLAFPATHFDAIVSCLGIPSIGHARCFAESYRVLRDGGRFVFSEWSGKGTPAGKAFFEILAKHRAATSPPEIQQLLEARRCIHASGEPADMRRPSDVSRKLEEVGFRDARHLVETHRVVYPSVEAYLARMSAWGDNDRELGAMSRETRNAFRREFSERVAPLLTDGRLVLEQVVLYFEALR